MKRMEDNQCRLVWWCPLFSLLGRIFPRFSLLVFRPVHPSCGPLGFRFEVSCTRNHGAKARACQTPKIKTFIAPSRCCCVQMARSYQACLTSASVNTTRCLVDVLISAWSKKKCFSPKSASPKLFQTRKLLRKFKVRNAYSDDLQW